MAGTLEVHLVTPEREVWVGEASIVIARAIDGDVGILPGHAPMVAALGVGALFIQSDGSTQVAAAVDGGFVHVVTAEDHTRVDVLAEHAVLPSEVDVAAARTRAQELQGRDDAEAQAELVRALMRAEHGTG